MSIFDEIKTGINEAIEYEKGDLKAKKTTLTTKYFDGWVILEEDDTHTNFEI